MTYPYKNLQGALDFCNRTGSVGIMVDAEWIRDSIARIAQLEAALVEAEAGRLHLYKEMLRLDNPPDTDECPQCGGKVEGSYSTWYECWEADMNHDEDCPLEIAHSALGRRWTDESFAQAKQKLEDLTKLQNGAK